MSRCHFPMHRIGGPVAALALAATTLADTNVAGPILGNTTWTLTNSPYVVTGSILIGAGATLTIQPGVVVRVNADLGIQVGSPEGFGPGTLVAKGTVALPIRFTSNASPGTQAPGDWIHIFFTALAGDAVFAGNVYQSGSILQHVIIEFGGAGGTATGSVTVDSASPFLDEVEVRSSARSGIRIDAGTAPALRITNCDLWSCNSTGQGGGGLYLNGGSGHVITGNHVHDNLNNSTGNGVYLQNATNVTVTGNTFENNDSPFSSGGGIFATGCTNLLFQSNTLIGNSAGNYGGAYMDGGSIDVLNNTFTGNASGNWAGLYVSSSNGLVNGNTISGNTALGTGGGGHLDGTNLQATMNEWTSNIATALGGVDVSGSNVLFVGNTVSDNQATSPSGDVGGMQISGSNSTYSDNTITGNSAGRDGGGLRLNAGTGHTFVGNLVDSNTAGARGGGVFSSATNSVWADNAITNNSAGTQGGAFHNNATGTSLAGDSGANVFNTLTGNDAPLGSAIYHNVPNGAAGNFAAQFVCWGTNDQQVVQSMIHDFFDNAALAIIFTFPLVEDCGAANPCPADLSGDGVVDGADLGNLLGAWATADAGADLNDDGTVDGADLGLLLGSWGACE